MNICYTVVVAHVSYSHILIFITKCSNITGLSSYINIIFDNTEYSISTEYIFCIAGKFENSVLVFHLSQHLNSYFLIKKNFSFPYHFVFNPRGGAQQPKTNSTPHTKEEPTNGVLSFHYDNLLSCA